MSLTTLAPSPGHEDVASPRTAPDLTIVIVSFNDVQWLQPCLDSIQARQGRLAVDITLVDNGSDDAHRFVAARYPEVRVIREANHGFGHANNRGVLAGTGRYVLFLNPDTELRAGTLAELVAEMDARPQVGLAGVRQILPDGTVWPTMRYFPGVTRALGDALGLERWPRRPRWAGERELDMRRYERETECDWVSGSFMIARREAILAAGLFDERFFVYSEEPDLCLRIRQAGFTVRHLPAMTILHHSAKGGTRPRMAAQDAFARRQYAAKHFTFLRREAYLAALGLGHALRLTRGLLHRNTRGPESAASLLALRTLRRREPPPLQPPPPTALPPLNLGRSSAGPPPGRGHPETGALR